MASLKKRGVFGLERSSLIELCVEIGAKKSVIAKEDAYQAGGD